jgi:hypothetical protein
LITGIYFLNFIVGRDFRYDEYVSVYFSSQQKWFLSYQCLYSHSISVIRMPLSHLHLQIDTEDTFSTLPIMPLALHTPLISA